jgi:hypothetical protein
MNYTADFETTVDENDCRVWAYAIAGVDDQDFIEVGNNLDLFFARCARRKENMMIYFHNLRFDGTFILDWLFREKYTWCKEKKELETKTFTTLITGDGKFYEIIVCFYKAGHHNNKVTFRDSLKLLPFTVEKIAEAFKLPLSKLKIDYKEYRPRGHVLTEQETDYVKNDVMITAAALRIMFDQGLNKMTIGSNALADFKKTVTFYEFDRYFPIPVYDEEIRQSYHGGYTYVRKDQRNKRIFAGLVLDKNSMYPWIMKTKKLPYGPGIYYSGQYKKNVLYNQFVQFLTCQFKLKAGYLPTIADKGFPGLAAHYLETSHDDVYALALTNMDLELLFRHYTVTNVEYQGGWMFMSRSGIFDRYIDKWMEAKKQAKADNNMPLYQISKLMLNSLYGKLAVNPRVRSKIPVFINDVVQYIDGPVEMRDPLYIPAAAFITSWARYEIITDAMKVSDRFLYCDTDSLHLSGTDIPEHLVIDPYELGAWKHELTFSLAKYIRPKCYLEFGHEKPGEYDTWRATVAGLPKTVQSTIRWHNFRPSVTFSGKLRPVNVPGGQILVDDTYTIGIK